MNNTRTPRRVQMSRQHPWRKDHPDAVIVARPSRWGNEYAVGATIRDFRIECERQGKDASHAFAPAVVTRRVADLPSFMAIRTVRDRADAVECFRLLVAEFEWDDEDGFRSWLSPLAGRDLACWCPLDQPCHADVLLEVANG